MGFRIPIVSDVLDAFSGDSGARDAGRAGRVQADAIREAAQINADAQRRALGELREQLGITRLQFAPFLRAGEQGLSDLVGDASIGGLGQNIDQIINSNAFGGLVDERRRAVEGQLASGGLTRSGTAIEEVADIPTDLAFQIENLLSGRTQNLVNTGLSAAAQEGARSGGLLNNIVNSITGAARSVGEGITGSAQATASGILGGAQARASGLQNLLNLGGTLGAAAIAFSDPRLKTNIKKVGSVGPFDLVEWEWIPELMDSFVKDFPTLGYLSTQVKEYYPEHVYEFGGYDVIDYPAVNEELAKWLQ